MAVAPREAEVVLRMRMQARMQEQSLQQFPMRFHLCLQQRKGRTAKVTALCQALAMKGL